ncbi:unnamed protein product [Discula destructiva]
MHGTLDCDNFNGDDNEPQDDPLPVIRLPNLSNEEVKVLIKAEMRKRREGRIHFASNIDDATWLALAHSAGAGRSRLQQPADLD